MPELKERLTNALNRKFKEEAYQELFLVDIQHLPNDIVHVFIDGDNGLLLDTCAAISRYLESEIEENQWLGEKYTLEVSSPGVGSPLKLLRQYKKNIGRNVSVEVHDSHKHIHGLLEAVNEEEIVVTYEEKVQIEGRKKKKMIEVKRNIPFENIKQTIVKITF